MRESKIKLVDIPENLLPVIGSNKDATIWLNGNEVHRIMIFGGRYRIGTNRGEYRYGLDTDLELNITT